MSNLPFSQQITKLHAFLFCNHFYQIPTEAESPILQDILSAPLYLSCADKILRLNLINADGCSKPAPESFYVILEIIPKNTGHIKIIHHNNLDDLLKTLTNL